jgi:hypothetical protein
MPPRGGNAKKEAGHARKAENKAKKNEAVVVDKVRVSSCDRTTGTETEYLQERQEASKWEQGTKKEKAADKEAKRQEQLARKAETARLLAEEETSAAPKKTTPKKTGNKKKDAKPAGPTDGSGAANLEEAGDEPREPESFSATGIDNALDLLDVVNAKTDKASVGQQAAGIERHPEASGTLTIIRSLAQADLYFPTLTAKIQGTNPFKRCAPADAHVSWLII